jgi:predicted NodU family carbamoyl transferase
VVTLDGEGDQLSGLVLAATSDGALQQFRGFGIADSLGHFYTKIGLFIGF